MRTQFQFHVDLEIFRHVLVFLSAAFRKLSLVLDPGGRLGRLGVLVRNLWTISVEYWVIVPESAGASLPELSIIQLLLH